MARHTALFALVSTVCIFISTGNAPAQKPVKTYVLDPLTVTATRLGPKYAATRSVTLIDRAAIERLPVQSVAHLLNYALGVSMNSRGTPGVQSDASLRGAGFEQVLILLDGVRMNDPQTGHHNMDLPVTLRDIERIEILRGQSSALYGPDAFGGVINIITRKPSPSSIAFDVKGGSFGTSSAALSLALPAAGRFANGISFEKARSDGYREDTDYKNTIFNWKSSYSGSRLRLTFFSGYAGKDFGANEFYVKGFDHYEETRAYTGGLRGAYAAATALTVTANVHFKRHKDHFELSRTRPSIYTADHTTDRLTAEVTGRYESGRYGDVTLGAETALEKIASNRLGDHDVRRSSLFGEYGNTIHKNILLSGGIRVDHHTAWGTEINPSAGIGYVLSRDFMVKASAGRAFRAPTFIELYSPAASHNIGDPRLKPEKALSYEIGCIYSAAFNLKGSTTVFLRSQDGAIDWIKQTPQSDWQAVNIFDIRSQGVEQECTAAVSDYCSLNMQYTFLDQNKKQEGFLSKYVLIHPRHQLMLSSLISVNSSVHLMPAVTYKDRPGINKYWVVDAKLSYSYRDYRFTIEGLNLTGSDYQDIRNVPMPGASVYAGISFVR